jgi:hypothetical protein
VCVEGSFSESFYGLRRAYLTPPEELMAKVTAAPAKTSGLTRRTINTSLLFMVCAWLNSKLQLCL